MSWRSVHCLLQEAAERVSETARHRWLAVAKPLALVLLISLLTIQAHFAGLLKPFEATELDALIRLGPLEARHVFIVAITGTDYQEIFGSSSPLDAERIAALIRAIADGKPALIVVDLDTSHPSFKRLSLPVLPCKVLWAQPAIVENHNLSPASSHRANLASPGGSPIFVTGAVLGREAQPPGVLTGLAALPEDSDGVVRYYCRTLPVAGGDRIEVSDSLPWAAVKAYRGMGNEIPGQAGQKLLLRFTGGTRYLPRISAGDLLAIHKGPGWKKLAEHKIVLLGGYYGQARDDFLTPLGQMAGVEILAQAIESELQTGGLKPVGPAFLFTALVAAGAILALLNLCFPSRWLLLAGLAAIPFLAVAFSLVSFLSSSLWFDFLPALVAVQLYFLFEHINRIWKQNMQLKQANAELERTRKDLARAVNRGAEMERRRLAHEMHDDTLGRLFQVSASLTPLAAGSDRAQEALSMLQDAMDGIRQVMMNLYPPTLDRYGLRGALPALVEKARGTIAQVKVIDESDGCVDALDKDTQLSLYRIVQQALNNAQKHARSDQVTINIVRRGDKLVLSIIDNGLGMSGANQRPDSYGLESMRSKAALIGASIQWVSPPAMWPTGTEVRVELPLAGNPE